MDHQQEHHQRHRKEREDKKEKEREHERKEANSPQLIHPLWFLVLGVVLTVLAVLIWTFLLT